MYWKSNGKQKISDGDTIKLELDLKLKGVFSKDSCVSDQIMKAKGELIEVYQFNEQIYCPAFMIKCHSYASQKASFVVIQDYYQKQKFIYVRKLQNVKIGSLSYTDKICIITKIAKILQYTTSKRICIRSLRPEMLAITKYPDDIDVKLIWLDKAKILDEGQSKIRYYYGDITSFTSPEIQAGKIHDTKADVWSFGAIFYYLIFGNTKLIRFSGGRLSVGYPEGTPVWLKQILENFLHQDPQIRPKIEVAFDYLKAMKICSQTAEKTLPKCSL